MNSVEVLIKRKQVTLVLTVAVSVFLKQTIFLGIGCIRLVSYKKTSHSGKLVLEAVQVRLLIEVMAE